MMQAWYGRGRSPHLSRQGIRIEPSMQHQAAAPAAVWLRHGLNARILGPVSVALHL